MNDFGTFNGSTAITDHNSQHFKFVILRKIAEEFVLLSKIKTQIKFMNC